MDKTTMSPESSDPFYIVTYYIKWATTSWTYCIWSYATQKCQKASYTYMFIIRTVDQR